MVIAAIIMGFGALKLMFKKKKPTSEFTYETPVAAAPVAAPAPAPVSQTLLVKKPTAKNAVPLWQQRMDGNADAFGAAKIGTADPLRSAMKPKRTVFGTARKGMLGVVLAAFAVVGAPMVLGLDGSTSLMSMNTIETGSDGESPNMWGSLLNSLKGNVGGGMNTVTSRETPTTDVIAQLDASDPNAAQPVLQTLFAQAVADVVVPVTPAEEMGRWDIDFAPVAQWFVAKAALAAMGDAEAQMLLGGMIFGFLFLLFVLRYFWILRSSLARRQRTASISSMGI